MKNLIYIIPIFFGMISCNEQVEQPKEWQFEKTIALDGINPIGITADGNDIFLSDGDHNRVLKVNTDGEILFEMEGFDRPMHLDFGKADLQITDKMTTSMLQERALFVPEYGRDSIAVMRDNKMDYLVINDSLDAPAGISVYENEIAIADFYTNRILYYNGSQWISFGKEGKAMGDFYYPTDVQITADKIFVADAYNNRGQVFDKTGKVLAEFGQDQNFNAATGIYVSDSEIFLTDFENDRVLVFGMDYQLKQVLESGIDKPTDLMVIEDILYITNYRNGEMIRYTLKPIMEE
ncbi:NHL repeat protein [Nonlabens sp. YIK11]|uniref:NHL repeat-containing protein n=1 Tax=Nonlabens sp. YIK11 TaxID=1453349 RepID=UPI0006DC815E|nr:NHL repeat-containing protein [Nonlabens sp. YIK11]KQC34343.1 NHL repeat protein [Nonlabens sp. YIK11]